MTSQSLRGYEVEIYIQDSEEPHYASGIYSLIENGWIKKPSRFRTEIDYETVKKKAAHLMDEIDSVYDYYAERDHKGALKMAENLMERIKKYRRAGLSGDGINSVENLVFKTLRRNDYLKKLSSLKILAYDASMSVNGSDLEEIIIVDNTNSYSSMTSPAVYPRGRVDVEDDEEDEREKLAEKEPVGMCKMRKKNKSVRLSITKK